MTDKNFTQIGVFGDDETLTIKATYDTWNTVVDDLRVGVAEFTKTVDEIENGIAPDDVAANAPFIKMFRQTIASRAARIEELTNIVEGENQS
jgi:hypothetical protein|tara:strand:+ start:1184 stop:1459 length:276 start_codon:yes stop_codon:yes gene_type:complete